MKTFTQFAMCYLLMWGLAYTVTAIVAPGIGGDPSQAVVLYSGLGIAIVVSVALRSTDYAWHGIRISGPPLFILAVIEVFGGILSWTGVSIWNVPFQNIELFQVSMAFADLVSAVLMFYLSFYRD